MPNTFPIRNLIPESSNQLVSHTLCIRGYLVHKYISFTRTFVCLVKQTGDSDYSQHPSNRRPRGPRRREKRGFSQLMEQLLLIPLNIGGSLDHSSIFSTFQSHTSPSNVTLADGSPSSVLGSGTITPSLLLPYRLSYIYLDCPLI